MLNRAVSQRKLTDAGRKAFIAAIDPFHDAPIDGLQGWPDLNTEPSVVRHWKDSYTVKAKEDGGAILIHTYPTLTENAQGFASRRNGVIDTLSDQLSPTNSHTMASVCVYNYTAAQATADNCPLIATPSPQVFASVPDVSWLSDGPCRLLGLGVEIRDVTADLYKQGTLTVYEQAQAMEERSQMIIRAQTIAGVSYVQTPINVVPVIRPPAGLQEMLIQPTTRQWDAREGCYFVVAIGENNEPIYSDYVSPALSQTTNGSDIPSTINIDPLFIGPWATGSVNGDNLVMRPTILCRTDSKGVYLTGLNANSTFTITVSYFMETFPINSSPLYPLATKSAAYDPVALKIIAEAAKTLPIGVPVSMNPLGEWFWDVVSAVAPILATGASMIFPAAAPALLPAGVAISEMASRQVTREEKKQLKKEIRKDNKQMIKAEIKSIKAQNGPNKQKNNAKPAKAKAKTKA